MERQELHRMFEGLAPTVEQERAMLDGLLGEERTVRPMKRQMKKLAVAFALAAVMLVTCAAAVVMGVDQRLLDYFGADQEEVLRPAVAASQVQSHTYANGWRVQISQVLADRYSIAAVLDLTAPEGITLSEDMQVMVDYEITGTDGARLASLYDAPLPKAKLDDEGNPYIFSSDWKRERQGTGIGECEYLESSQPEQGRISVLWKYQWGYSDDGFVNDQLLGAQVKLSPKGLALQETQETLWLAEADGLWMYEFSLPESDSGRIYEINQPLQLGESQVQLTRVYLSPLGISYEFQRGPDTSSQYGLPLYDKSVRSYALILADGSEISVNERFGHFARGGVDHIALYPEEWIDPEQAVAFSLFGQVFALDEKLLVLPEHSSAAG